MSHSSTWTSNAGIERCQSGAQALCNKPVGRDRHHGRAGSRDPHGACTAVEADAADVLVIGDERLAIRLLQLVFAGGGDKLDIAAFESARKARDAAHLPHGGGKGNFFRDDLSGAFGLDLVRRDDGDEFQMRIHVVADAVGQRALGRKGADERAHDGGATLSGWPSIWVAMAHRFGSSDDAPRQSGGAHDACDGAGGRRPQAARHGNARVDVDGDREGFFPPVFESEDERAIDEVVLVAVFFGAAVMVSFSARSKVKRE